MIEPSIDSVRMSPVRKNFGQLVRGRGRNVLPALAYFFGAWLGALIVWQLVAQAIDSPVLIPSPLAVAVAFYHLMQSGTLFNDSAVSLGRIAIGYGMALVVGIGFGIFMGLIPLVRDLVEPVVELFRPISGIAWIPLALIMFGIGSFLPIYIVFYGSVFPIILNTMSGILLSDPSLKRAALTMGVSRWVIVRQVFLPSALPMIFTGARIAIGLAWMSIVAGELLGSSTGLGYAIGWYQELLQTPNMVAIIVAVGVLGYVSDLLVRLLESTFMPWRTQSGGGR